MKVLNISGVLLVLSVLAVISHGTLVANWRMTPGSATSEQDVVGNFNGASQSVVTAANDPYFGIPLRNFQTPQHSVRVPYNSALNPEFAAVTFWLNPTNLGGGPKVVMDSSFNGNSGWRIDISAGKLNATYFTTNNNTFSLFGPTLIANQWRHVALMLHKVRTELYIDGLPYESNVHAEGDYFRPNPSADLIIGPLFTGTMYNVRLYDTQDLTKSEVDASRNLVALWSLNEITYDQAADSVGGNHGTWTNRRPDSLARFDPKFPTNPSAYFDGSNYITIPYSSSVNRQVFSVRMWAKSTDLSNEPRVAFASWSTAEDKGYIIGLAPTWFITFSTTGGIRTITSTSTCQANQWCQVVASFGSNVNLFVNGMNYHLEPGVTFAPITSSGEIYIGAESPYSKNWIGFLDEIEILDFAYAPPPASVVFPTPAALWYQFDETSGTVVANSASGAPDGTFYGPRQQPVGNTPVSPQYTPFANNYVNVSFTPALNLPESDPFTISVWVRVRPGALNGEHTILSSTSEPNTGYKIVAVDQGGNARVVIGGTSIEIQGNALFPGVWSNIFVRYDGRTAHFYIDCQRRAMLNVLSLTPNDDEPLLIGARIELGSVDKLWDGDMDELYFIPTASLLPTACPPPPQSTTGVEVTTGSTTAERTTESTTIEQTTVQQTTGRTTVEQTTESTTVEPTTESTTVEQTTALVEQVTGSTVELTTGSTTAVVLLATTEASGVSSQVSGSGGGASVPIIAGAVGGIAFLIILILLVVVVFLLLRRRSKRNQPNPEPHAIELSDKSNASKGLHELNNVKIVKKLGGGAFGEVYLGDWNATEVALKKLKGEEVEEFKKEVEILLKLSHHPNIVQFFGICKIEQDQYIVTEFLEKGSVLDLLAKDTEEKLAPTDFMDMLIGACKGLVYLESEGVLHRDLAARNLLVVRNNDRYNVKISDFGMSRQTNYYMNNDAKIPIKWTAPEILAGREYSAKADVWSFGIVFWEIFSRGTPPYNWLSNKEASEEIESGTILKKPKLAPQELYDLIVKTCWQKNPAQRSSFAQLLPELIRCGQACNLVSEANISSFSVNVTNSVSVGSNYSKSPDSLEQGEE